jgi:WD40 repeat protein
MDPDGTSFDSPSRVPECCPVCSSPMEGRAWCAPCLLRGAVRVDSEPGVVSGPEPGMDGVFGDYRLRERMGEGGMGVVYRAYKVSLKKDVAIKFIKAGRRASDRQIALFLREAELASQLDHPNIIAVSEVGERDGIRFLVMRYVEGAPLSARLASVDFLPTVRERVELLSRIVRAVDHAHQRGVIHRDLKPGNILIARDGSPHVGDFGLARWVERETTVTVGDRAIGTPAFMPPEQARGRREDLTLASDIWSLGVMLYQLLSGRLPFEADTVASAVHRILHEDPAGPLTGSAPTGREEGDWERWPVPADAGHLFGPARRDLESICLRCLRKEPGRRYPTAAALADDLDRWLEGRPVEARPVAGLERVVLWARRRPALAGLAVVSLVALGALVATAWQRQVGFRTERLRREFNYVADLNLVKQALIESNSVVFDRAMEDARPGPGEEDLRGIEWGLWHTLRESVTHPVWFRANQPLMQLAVSDRTGWVAAAGTNVIHLLAASGLEGRRWYLEGAGGIGALAFAPDGGWLAAGHTTGLDLISVSGDLRRRLTEAPVSEVAVSADGAWLAAAAGPDPGAAGSDRVLVFELPGGRLARAFERSARAVAWDAADGALRVGTDRGEVYEWKDRAGDLVGRVGGGYRSPAFFFSGDGRRAARTSIYGVAHVFEATSGAAVREFRGLPVGGVRMAFSPDDRRVAVTTTESAVRVVDLAGEEPDFESLPGHVDAITALAFIGGGREVLSASRDGTVRRMTPGGRRPEPFVAIPHGLPNGAGVVPRFSPDGRWVALLEERAYFAPFTNEWTVVWDTRTGQVASRIPSEVIGWGEAGRLLTWDRDGRLRMWEVTNPAAPRELAGFRLSTRPHPKLDPQVVDQGRWVVSVTADLEAQGFEVRTGRILRLEGRKIELLAGAPEGARVAVALESGEVALWDFASDRLIPLHARQAADIRYSGSGRLLAVTDWERQLRLFDGRTGEALAGLRGHLGAVAAVAFTPDERQLVTGGDDSWMVVWNLATRREVLRLRLDAPVYWIQVSPDQRWLVTGHLPTQVGLSWGSLGRGQYRLWPITGLPARSPVGDHPPGPDSIWRRYEALAAGYPP